MNKLTLLAFYALAWPLCAQQAATLQDVDQISYRWCTTSENNFTIVDTETTTLSSKDVLSPSFTTSFKVTGSCSGTSITFNTTITTAPTEIMVTPTGSTATSAKYPVLSFSPQVVTTTKTTMTVNSPYLATASFQTGGDTQGLGAANCPGSTGDNTKSATLTQTCTRQQNYQDPSIGNLVAPDCAGVWHCEVK
jgi:hypothetical protein